MLVGSSVLGPPEVCEVQWSFRISMVVFGSFQNVSHSFQASDDRQESLSWISYVPFSTGKTLGCESHWVPFVHPRTTGIELLL